MANSVSVNIMEALRTRLRALTFTGILDANIIVVEDPRLADREGTELPAILITPGSPESFGTGEVSTDEVIYKYLVAIVDHHDGGLIAGATLDARLLWRENARLGMQHWTPNIATVWDSRLEPLQPIDRKWLPRNLWVSAFILAVHSDEVRTA